MGSVLEFGAPPFSGRLHLFDTSALAFPPIPPIPPPPHGRRLPRPAQPRRRRRSGSRRAPKRGAGPEASGLRPRTQQTNKNATKTHNQTEPDKPTNKNQDPQTRPKPTRTQNEPPTKTKGFTAPLSFPTFLVCHNFTRAQGPPTRVALTPLVLHVFLWAFGCSSGSAPLGG